jgi:hypothetical protein
MVELSGSTDPYLYPVAEYCVIGTNTFTKTFTAFDGCRIDIERCKLSAGRDLEPYQTDSDTRRTSRKCNLV